jgi:branched-chain amino acid transport system ATP-binding protein
VTEPFIPRHELMRVTDLHAFYGAAHVLHGVDLSVANGELITLLGRNGSGRTTTLKAILGLVDARSGSVMVNGRETIHLPTHRIVHLGLGYCPEERGIFSSLTAEENLLLPPPVSSAGMGVDALYQLFPNLAQRRKSPGGRLSGGEQQMLALARILRAGARLLLLDEITEGLAPSIVQVLSGVMRTLKDRGFTVVLAEQNFRFAASLADRHYLLEHGRITDMIPAASLSARGESLHRFLGL